MVPGQMTSVPLVGFDIEHVCLPPPPGGSPSTPDTFNEDRDTTHSSVPTSNYACRLCHLQFTTITEMQRHFKSEAHINSIHATRVTNYVGELESRRLNSPKLFFSFNNALYSVYKVCFSSLPCSLAELQFELSQLKDAIWVIILIRSGYFSLGIYELVTSKCIASKQLKRYTTRRSQGGSQSSNDSKCGNRTISAGALIRRHNELELVKDIGNLLERYNRYLIAAHSIFWNPTEFGAECLFKNSINDLDKDNPRLKNIPFTTHRPSQAENGRCLWELSHASFIGNNP